MLGQTRPPENSAPDNPLQRLQFDFTGQWLPDMHPLKISNGNYSDLQNMRHNKTNIVGVNGYTKINSVTALSAYPNGRSGFQLRSPHTQRSYVFAQQYNAGLTGSQVYLNKGTPPAVSDFEATVFHTDGTGAGLGTFAEAPDNNMVYANGVETLIYGGEEAHIAAFILTTGVSGLTLTSPIVYTDEIRNTLTTAGEVVAIVAATHTYLIGSTRPLIGIKPYISVANTVASTPVIAQWTGTAWSNVAISSDGTSVAGKTHAQTGMILFPTTVGVSKPAFLNDTLYYWYKVSLTAGACTLYHVTVNAPKQALVDLWDGVNRVCTQCQISRSSVYEDYTPEVYDSSTVQYPIAAKFAGIASTDHAILMFSDRTTAIKWSFIAGLINKTAATVTIYYWNGVTWATVGTVYDGTLDSGATKSMAQNGTMYWDAPAITLEHACSMFGVYGFAYKLVWSDTLTADDGSGDVGCYADTIYGIPAVNTMGAYKFTFNYKNRIFLAGDVAGKEGHGMDYSAKDTADCFNGKDTSANGKRLYIGKNSSDLVAAANIFNRFGSNIYNSELLLKPTETFLLDGDDPETFRVSQISENLGTQAPQTVCTAEVAFEVTKDAIRNIAMWISNTGPVIFDAAVLVPVRGIDLYFDRTKTDTCVNFDSMANAHAWFDPNYYEWNVCLPSGVGQTTCNVWLAYDLIEKRWTKRNVSTQYIPQAVFKVVDDYGNIYFYGLIDTGHMVRLENGNLWNETDSIEGYIITNAILPTGSMFDITTIRNIKLLTEGDGTYDIEYTRSDIEIKGSGIESGDLRIYGQLIEDPANTGSYWDGDDFVCKQLLEYQVVPGGNWQDIGGVVSIIGQVVDVWTMEITTAAGNFLTAGFLPGLVVTTSDPNNPGPFLCTAATATTLTFSSGKAIDFQAGASITLYAMFTRVWYYADGDTTPALVPFNQWEMTDEFAKFMSSCGYTAMCHKFKFSFYSSALSNNIKPLAWGIQYMLERDEA